MRNGGVEGRMLREELTKALCCYAVVNLSQLLVRLPSLYIVLQDIFLRKLSKSISPRLKLGR